MVKIKSGKKTALFGLFLIINIFCVGSFLLSASLISKIPSGTYTSLNVTPIENSNFITTLPQSKRISYLSLLSRNQTLKIYLDDTLIFTNENTDDPNGIALYTIKVPNHDDGARLTLNIDSSDPHFKNRIEPLYYGESASLAALRIIQSIPDIMLTLFVLTLGLSMFYHSTKEDLELNERNSLQFASLYGLSWSIYFLSATPIIVGFFAPKILSFMNYGLYIFLTYPLLQVLKNQLSHLQRYACLLIKMYIPFMLIAFGFILFIPKSLYVFYYIALCYQYISLIIAVILFLIESIQGVRKSRTWLMVSLTLTLAIFISDALFISNDLTTNYFIISFVIAYLIAIYFIHTVYTSKQISLAYSEIKTLQSFNISVTNDIYQYLNEHMHTLYKSNHEIKNHLITMNLLLENNDTNGFIHYLQNFSIPEVELGTQYTNILTDIIYNLLEQHKMHIDLTYNLTTNQTYDFSILQIVHFYLSFFRDIHKSYKRSSFHYHFLITSNTVTILIMCTKRGEVKKINSGIEHMRFKFNKIFSNTFALNIQTEPYQISFKVHRLNTLK